MPRRNWKAIAEELDTLYYRAEALADTLDPGRTFSAKDEATRSVVQACDKVIRATGHARSILRVSGKAA